ncbi:hypothetical protein OAO65_02120 [Flavobacteriales bacterium]|nr:hypothetical protein [Flavobacteriales bacterium]
MRQQRKEKTMRNELIQHVIDTIQDQQLTTLEDLHFHAFNEDYYIVGYYNAEQWLVKHDISAFEAIGGVIDWEIENLGETQLNEDNMNAEHVVNLYVYMKGEELLSEFDLDQEPSDLLIDLKEALNQ